MNNRLSDIYLSDLSGELAMAVGAGMSAGEALSLISEGEKDRSLRELLAQAAEKAAGGASLSAALNDSGRFPDYMLDMLEAGEATGELDRVLTALADYYERRTEMRTSVKNAVVYPCVLLIMLLFVVAVLILKVLPVFDSVYGSLGAEMEGAAGFFLKLSVFISERSVLFLAVLGALTAAVAAVAAIPPLRHGAGRLMGRLFRNGKTSELLARERVASVLAMGLKSGMDASGAAVLARKLEKGKPFEKRLGELIALSDGGEAFASACERSGVLSAYDARFIAVAFRSGRVDEAMEELAGRYGRAGEERLAVLIRRIEPTLVAVMSTAVGVILLSVMLPLMQLMSAL